VKLVLISKSNNFNLIRLICCAIVVADHSFALAIEPTSPLNENHIFKIFEMLANFSVKIFFFISGYLLINSASTQKKSIFLKNRILRIYPGFLISHISIAFLLAPLAFLQIEQNLQITELLKFLIFNLSLYPLHPVIGTSLGWAPHSAGWNLPNYTLFHEMASYILLALLSRKLSLVCVKTLLILNLFTLMWVKSIFSEDLSTIKQFLLFFTFFCFGMLTRISQKNKKQFLLFILPLFFIRSTHAIYLCLSMFDHSLRGKFTIKPNESYPQKRLQL
jgi:peptidoglycan/LPS O-acetylase OafA/YrhL